MGSNNVNTVSRIELFSPTHTKQLNVTYCNMSDKHPLMEVNPDQKPWKQIFTLEQPM